MARGQKHANVTASSSSEDECTDNRPAFGQSTPTKHGRYYDFGAESSLDISNLSFSQLSCSQQELQKEKQKPGKKKVEFVIPKKPKKKLKAKHVCTYCGKSYICKSSYNTHVLNHKVQDFASRYPDKTVILDSVIDIGKKALNKVAKVPSVGESGARFQCLVRDISTGTESEEWKKFLLELCEMVLDSSIGVAFMLPSKLLTLLMDQVEVILSDRNNHVLLLSTLDLPPAYTSELQSNFLLEFLFSFAFEIVVFISSQICESHDSSSCLIELDQDQREVIYYIGGSIMRGYCRMARRYKGSRKWTAIWEVIKNNVVTDQPVGDSSWTMAVDRGALLYITKECRDFFIGLTEIVFSLEKRDGSIDYDQVITNVSQSYVPVLWDRIFTDSLPEGMSLSFMNDVTRSFCKTCGRGFAKRRLNNVRKGPMISMPTRHLVASRKNRK